MTLTTIIHFNILAYDPDEHIFSPEPRITRHDNGDYTAELTLEQAGELGVVPSDAWLNDYHDWNDFHNNPNGFRGHPIFAKVQDLYDFNDTGAKLVSRLQSEMNGKPDVHVEPFAPLYSNIKVGESLAAWWHVKDKSYGYVVPIQHLPVSDDLKSRLQAWRMRCSSDWLSPARRSQFQREGHDLEEHILWELNVRCSDDATCSTTAEHPMTNPKRLNAIPQESFESIDAGMDRMSVVQ